MDIGGYWWILVDIGGYWWILVDIGGYWEVRLLLLNMVVDVLTKAH